MMNKQVIKQTASKGFAVLAVIILATFVMAVQPANAKKGMKRPKPEIIKAIIIGDRVLDIAYNLGVLPEAMSVRCSIWPMCKKLKTASQILGCPMCTTVKKKDTVPKALKKFGIKRVILEKSKLFCIYKPEVNPINIASILEGMDVKIEYVDFSQGLESAIRQTAMLIDREDRADELIKKYKKNLDKAKAALPKEKLGKKVLILSSTYQSSSGKLMLRVEAPGGYADRFLLDPLGCVNVGDSFKPAKGKPQKGHYPVKKKKGGFVLDPIIKANPDVIVMTGNAFAAQKAIAEYMKNNPALANVKALKNQAIYSLPFYLDSSVIEYPDILRQWAVALSD
jgi:hypothetical protein